MPTLREPVDLPAGVAPEDVTAILELWDGTVANGVTSGRRIGGAATTSAVIHETDGVVWTFENVVGNVDIDPGGTVYRITRTWPGLKDPIETFISMPASGGPYTPDDIDTDPPDDLPTVEPTNELDVSEITGNLTLTGFNGFNILQVPGMTVTKPAVDRPCWSRAQVWMEHASAANVNLATMIGNTGLSIIGTQLAAGIGFVGPAGAETSPEAWARYASGSAAVDQDVYVYSTVAGNVNVIANGSNPLRHVVFGM